LTRLVSNDKSKSSLSIVVPVFNEEALISDAVQQLVETASEWVDDAEILLVNDGSHDNSPKIIDDLAEKFDMVRALHQSPNKGFGAAVRKGYEYATKDLVTYCPADHHFSDKEFDIYLTLINHADIVLGYRRERRSEQTLYAWMRSRYYHLLLVWFFKLDLFDVNWIHMYHRDQLPHFLGQSDGPFFLAENLILAQRLKKRILGVDVEYKERELGVATGAQIKTVYRTLRDFFVFFFK